VWVPDPAHEAMRNLVRARTVAVETVRAHKQQVNAFLLRHGRIFLGRKNWGARYRRWLQQQSFEHPADQIVLQEYVEAVRLGEERLARIESAIEEFLPSWPLAPVVEALQALRGVDLVVAVTFAVEIGDIRRFASPRQLMGYLGLVPEERSTGETVRRGSITRMGNVRLRQLLVESAWTYRYPPRVGAKKLMKLQRVPPKIREIAWKAQSRLTARFRIFVARGKKATVACTAIARELAGFMWAVAREVQPA
jgi:transposase